MDIRPLSPAYAVSPQITPQDVPAIASSGYTTVLCNRPDPEVPETHQAGAVRAACEAANIAFVYNPFDPRALTPDLIETQKTTLTTASGPILAYCASGNRSTILWCFTQAGTRDTAELFDAARAQGYSVDHLGPQLEAYAAQAAS